ncbi:MAG: hypothetical protein A2W25_12040 [candidate division Zixibacteria bacterium RBG_16_53_22]|nr:MAG: hypothetical protein A2W25_12040 [candidate division Zixibacteria bacterium RBG_16_53_22]
MATSWRQDNAWHLVLKGKVLEEIEDTLDTGADWVAQEFTPEEVFGIPALKEWAEEHGYVKEE